MNNIKIKNLNKLFTLLLLILSFISVPLYAQISLVPANHDVYSWLHQQRVNGHIKGFQYEDLPISRGEIVEYLKDIEKEKNSLSYSDNATLTAFLKELDPKGLLKSYETGIFTSNQKFIESVKYAARFTEEPNLLAYYDSTSNVNGAFNIMFGRGELYASENNNPLRTSFYYKGVRIYGSVQDFVGLHVEAENVSISGDEELLIRDQVWGPTGAVQRQGSTSSYSYEAFVTLKKELLSFDIGRGSLRIGPGITSSIILRETAPNFNWMRFKISGAKLKFTSIHGSLYADNFDGFVRVGMDSARTRVAPERWFTLHRLSIRPLDRLQISITEFLTYSNRSSDLSYLNPVSPIFFSELENGDRDNAFMAIDIVAQPIDKIELYGSVLIDDLNSLKDILKDNAVIDDDVAINFGAIASLPFASQFAIGYTRVEPFVYTHWQQLNTFEQRGQSLGHYLGPNADELEVRIKKWLPYRAWVQLSFKKVRKGFNPIDNEGIQILNIGGDVLDGSNNLGYRMFQGSDLNKWSELEFRFQVEPKRGIMFSANVLNRNIIDGDRLNDYLLGDFRFEIRF